MGHFGEAFDIILRRMALRQDEAAKNTQNTGPREIPIEEIVESIVDQLRHKEPTLREKLLSHYMKGYRMGTLEDLSTYMLQMERNIPMYQNNGEDASKYFFVNNSVLRTKNDIFILKGSPILCFPEIAYQNDSDYIFTLSKKEYEDLISRKGEVFRIDQTKTSDLAKTVKREDSSVRYSTFYDIGAVQPSR